MDIELKLFSKFDGRDSYYHSQSISDAAVDDAAASFYNIMHAAVNIGDNLIAVLYKS